MAKTSTQPVKSRPAKSRAKSPMRDIKAKSVPRDVFTIRHLKPEDGVPEVEPLMEDINNEDVIMEIDKIEPEIEYQPVRPPRMSVTAVEDEEPVARMPVMEEREPKDTIKVKFSKFVQLVTNHDFEDVIETHANDEIIMSSNLLTDLAGASDRKEERKIPLVFIVGIAIGVVLTYIFFSQ
jgi:hypothetical protein